MRSPNGFLIAATMMGVALAGCAGAGDDLSLTESDVVNAPVFDAETGAIAGSVQTDEFLPLAGATVGIVDPEMLVQTDDDGIFAIGNVPPGQYKLGVTSIGYQSQARSVEVVVGQVAQVEFILDAAAVEGPYHWTDQKVAAVEAYMWKLTPECVYTDVDPLVKTCGGVRRGCEPTNNCEVHYEEETGPDWVTIFGEVDWDQQSGVTGRGFLFDVNAPNITRGNSGSVNQADPYTWSTLGPDAPIITRIDKPDTLLDRGINPSDWDSYPKNDCTAPDASNAGNCDWFYRLFAGYCDLGSQVGNCETTPDYGVAVDNPATIFFTIFYIDPAPLDWTALPDR